MADLLQDDYILCGSSVLTLVILSGTNNIRAWLIVESHVVERGDDHATGARLP